MVTSRFWHALKNRPSLLWNKCRETWGSKSILFKHQIVITLTAYSPTVDMAPTNRDPFATPTDHPKSSLVPMTSEKHFWFESMIEFEMWFMNHRMKTVRKHLRKTKLLMLLQNMHPPEACLHLACTVASEGEVTLISPQVCQMWGLTSMNQKMNKTNKIFVESEWHLISIKTVKILVEINPTQDLLHFYWSLHLTLNHPPSNPRARWFWFAWSTV